MLTPQEKQQIDSMVNDLKGAIELLENIRQSTDLPFTESLRRRVLDDVVFAETIDSSVGDMDTVYNIAAVPASFTTPKIYDRRIPLIIDGEKLYVGAYLS